MNISEHSHRYNITVRTDVGFSVTCYVGIPLFTKRTFWND